MMIQRWADSPDIPQIRHIYKAEKLTRCGDIGKDWDSPDIGTQVKMGTYQMWGHR